MSKFKIWWVDYKGYMTIPFLTMGLVVLFRYEELPTFLNVSYALFVLYIAYYSISFIRKEVGSSKSS